MTVTNCAHPYIMVTRLASSYAAFLRRLTEKTSAKCLNCNCYETSTELKR